MIILSSMKIHTIYCETTFQKQISSYIKRFGGSTTNNFSAYTKNFVKRTKSYEDDRKVINNFKELFYGMKSYLNLQKIYTYHISPETEVYTEMDFNNYDAGFKSIGIRNLFYQKRFQNIKNDLYVDASITRLPYKENMGLSFLEYIRKVKNKRSSITFEHYVEPELKNSKLPFSKMVSVKPF